MFSIDLGNLTGHLKLDDTDWNRKLKHAGNSMRSIGQSMSRVGRDMTMKVTAPILGLGAASVKAFANFDDAMTKSLAIFSDMTDEMRSQMEIMATDVSSKTITSATELARAYFYLGSAGLDAAQSLTSLNAVNEFAIAGSFDLSAATEMAVGSQAALGLTSKNTAENLKNLKRVTDNLVTANELSQATVSQFSEALTNEAAAAMKVWGIELEEGTAILAAYAKQNIKGSEAGSAFGRMLRFMMMGARQNKDEWKKLGLTLYDTQGKLRPLADVIENMTKILGNMSTEQKGATLDLLGFQARSQQVILPLLGMSDSIREWNERLEQASGHTKELAEKNMKSFSAQIKIVWNNVVNLSREIGQILAPYIEAIGNKIKNATQWFKSLNTETKELIIRYGLYTAAAGPVLLITGKLLSSLGFMVLGFHALSKALTPVLLKLAAISLPITAIIAVVVLLAAAVYTLRAAWNQGVEAIRDRLEALADYFRQTFNWLKETIGPFLGWFVESFYQAFEEIRTGWQNFIADLYATTRSFWDWASKIQKGINEAWSNPNLIKAIKGFRDEFKKANAEWSKDFADSWDKAQDSVEEFKRNVESGYETATLYIKAYGEATKEHLGELGEALKKQFGEDISDILDLINSKIKSIQESGVDVLPADQVNELNAALQELLDKLDELPEKGKYAFTSLKEHIKDATDISARFEDVAIRAFDETADAITEFAMTGKMQIKDLARTIISDLLRAIIRMQMAKAVTHFFPSLAPTAGAKGLVFSQGQIIPMATGGIIGAPSLIPMANQQTALVGEAGPEAVMPLTRTSGGELGVRSETKMENKLKIVNVMDREQYLAAMQSEPGEKVIMNILRRNGVI